MVAPGGNGAPLPPPLLALPLISAASVAMAVDTMDAAMGG